MPPDGDDDHRHQGHGHQQIERQVAEPRLGRAERLAEIHGIDQRPGHQGEAACRHQHRPAAVVLLVGGEPAGILRPVGGIQIGGVDPQFQAERRHRLLRVGDRREVDHLVVLQPHQHRPGALAGFARLDQQRVELVRDLLHADDAADLRRLRPRRLHREDGHGEDHRGIAGAVEIEIADAALAQRLGIDEGLHVALVGRGIGGSGDHRALGIDDDQSGDQRPGLVRIDGRAVLDREAGAIGGHRQQVAQVVAQPLDLVGLRRIGGQFADLVDIELQRFVLRQAVEFGQLAVEPAADFRRPAVGDNAHADPPLGFLALPLLVDEDLDREHADHGNQHQDDRREQDLEIQPRLAGFLDDRESSRGWYRTGWPAGRLRIARQ